jgi:hypothetical protein
MREVVTELDDTLRHQTSLTFNQVGTSDHRFMDRYWYMTVAPDASIGMVTGLGAYPNMNVFDGYACVVVDGDRQLNTRVSRRLRPDIDRLGSGPISYINEIPHQRNRIVLAENSGPLRMDLTFVADEPPRLEAPHRTLIDGQLIEDYRRLHQGGKVTGTIRVGDRTWNVDEWYGAKDHSWGVRSHFGGATIVRAGHFADDFSGLYTWAGFTCGNYHGYIQTKDDGSSDAAGLRYSDGEMLVTEGGVTRALSIVKTDYDIDFNGNSNLFSVMRHHLVSDTGEEFDVEVRPAHHAFAMMGTGYFDGFNDRRGFGSYRGDDVVEHDEYRLFADGWVTFPNGRRGTPWHRELPSIVTCNGESGFGYSCALVEGTVERYGLKLAKRSRQGNGVTWEDGRPDTRPSESQGEYAASPPDSIPADTVKV